MPFSSGENGANISSSGYTFRENALAMGLLLLPLLFLFVILAGSAEGYEDLLVLFASLRGSCAWPSVSLAAAPLHESSCAAETSRLEWTNAPRENAM